MGGWGRASGYGGATGAATRIARSGALGRIGGADIGLAVVLIFGGPPGLLYGTASIGAFGLTATLGVGRIRGTASDARVGDDVVLDPDQQVQASLRHLFETFRRTGSGTRRSRCSARRD